MPYSRPYASGFSDYPATTTPINATALNTMDVGIKTANDQFQTVTTAQRTALTPTVGQCVWDSDLRQLMVYMNASGGNAWQPIGNRIICTSTTRPATPFEGQQIYETDTNKTYVYDGSAWIQIGEQPILTTAQRDALPATVTAGTMIYNSSLGNMQIYTGSTWDNYPRIPAVGLQFVSNTAYTPGASNPIPFGAENYDTDGFHDNTTNNSRITIPAGLGGTYLFEANVMFNFSTVPTVLEVLIRCNATMESTKAIRGGVFAAANQAANASYHASGIAYNVVAGDYFDVCIQVTGGTYTATPITGGLTTVTPTYFRATRIGFA